MKECHLQSKWFTAVKSNESYQHAHTQTVGKLPSNQLFFAFDAFVAEENLQHLRLVLKQMKVELLQPRDHRARRIPRGRFGFVLLVTQPVTINYYDYNRSLAPKQYLATLLGDDQSLTRSD